MASSQNKQQFSVAILAYGVSGRIFHAPFVHSHPGLIFRGVVERNPERKRVQKDYDNVISYNSIDEVFDDDKVTLVIVNTPSDTHYEFAKRALMKGKNVVIEKPLTETVEQAKEIFEIARKMNVRVFPYHQMRYSSDYKSLRSVLEHHQDGSKESIIGRPVELHLRWDRFRLELNAKKWKEDPNLATSGLTYDLAPHLIDQAIALFGRPSSVYKTQGCFRPDSKVDDWFNFQLYYSESQLSVFISASLVALKPGPAILCHGTRGTFEKYRGDVQEKQLHAGVLPTSSEYGQETSEDTRAKITTLKTGSTSADSAEERIEEVPMRGSFMEYFDGVYSCLCDPSKKFLISEQEVITVMELVQHPKGYWEVIN